jgi:hypothetical protein
MIKKIILLLIPGFLFSACENSTDVNTELPYEEYTVINAQLSAFEICQGVMITHTLPLDVPYDITKAEIKDAVVYILENGIRVIPLHYNSNGLYKPLGDITIKAGTRYELFSTINNKSIYSETIVPEMPNVLDVSNVNNDYLTAQVEAKPGEAYGAAWIITTGGNSLKADDFFSIETTDQYPSNVFVRSQDIPAPYNSPAYRDNMYIQVYAFDKSYKDYFRSKTNNDPINNTFTSGGGSIAWNVYGDHVIGLFIGLAEGYQIHP